MTTNETMAQQLALRALSGDRATQELARVHATIKLVITKIHSATPVRSMPGLYWCDCCSEPAPCLTVRTLQEAT